MVPASSAIFKLDIKVTLKTAKCFLQSVFYCLLNVFLYTLLEGKFASPASCSRTSFLMADFSRIGSAIAS